MTDINTVRIQLDDAAQLGNAAGFTDAQHEAFKALWYAIDALADLVVE